MNLFQRAGSFDFIGNTDKDRCPITEWVIGVASVLCFTAV